MGTEKEKYTQIDRAQIEKIMCRQKQFFQTGKTLEMCIRDRRLYSCKRLIWISKTESGSSVISCVLFRYSHSRLLFVYFISKSWRRISGSVLKRRNSSN